MVDFSQLFGQPIPGLLSPEQQGNAGTQGLMSLGAGLIKAGGPSEYKNNFGGVGDAIQGGLDAYSKATTQQLQAQYMRGQINKQTFDQTMTALQVAAQYRGADLPVPLELQALLSKNGIAPHPSDAQPAPAPQAGPGPAPMPSAGPPPAGPGGGSILPFQPGSPPPQITSGGPAPEPAQPPGLLSPPQGTPMPPPAPEPTQPPGLLSPPQGAPMMPPQGAPMPPQGPGVAGIVKTLPFQDRYALIGGGPMGKIVEGVTQKNLEQTNEGKNARDPAVLDFEAKKAAAAAAAKNLEMTSGAKDARDPAVLDFEAKKAAAAAAAKNLEMTSGAKDARDPMIAPAASAVEAAKTGAAADTKYFDSVYRGLTGSATIAAQQKQNLALLRQIAASPNFTPGAGSDLALGAQRLAAQFGINPTGAAPRELFNQLAARVLADQFSGMKSMASETGEQSARIFKPMLDIEEKANITPNDSLAGIHSKLDMLDKSGDLMMKWGDMADDYKTDHGRLDAKFNKQLREEIAGSRIGNVLPAAPAKGPPVGHVHNGFTFKGGDPNNKANWTQGAQ